MSRLDKNQVASAITEAIRAKRDRRSSTALEIAQLEESLMADLDSFDLEAIERQALQSVPYAGGSSLDSALVFPEIAPEAPDFHQIKKTLTSVTPQASNTAAEKVKTGFLDQLKQQATRRQMEVHSALAERTSVNESIDAALKRVFNFLHDMVQQLNIVKPDIPRGYALTDKFALQDLVWQEGFADYRTQTQSDGALTELVTFTYQLSAPGNLLVRREGLLVERFRTLLFDYGLQFSCKEFRNERQYVESAEFDIKPQLSVSARWRADFVQGKIILETRNLERLGSLSMFIRPEQIDQDLLDAFGYLVIGQPNRFRELTRR